VVIAAVNLLWIRPGRVGGSEEYLVRQLTGLRAADDGDVGLRLAVPPGLVDAHPELATVGDLRRAPRWVASRPGRLLAESAWLPGQCAGADVVHHGGGTVPPRTLRPVLLTIHDVQYLRYPHYFSPIRRRYLALAMPRSARRAAVIAVPSEFVKATVVDAYGTDADRVVVVSHGVDPPEPEQLPAEAELRRRYGLGDRRAVVLPAITHPHKGHRFLVDVVAKAWTDADVVVVMTGGAGPAEQPLREAIVTSGAAERIVRTGRVPDRDRWGLIALAEALAFPSEYEGFGAPVIEAMALGTPVVCSDRASLPEVAGDAALVRSLDVAAWASALDDVAADRAGLIARGRARAAAFTAAVSGAALATAFRQAAKLGSDLQ
jgi:glycosyltransferase involved in cell wall biosynthesis